MGCGSSNATRADEPKNNQNASENNQSSQVKNEPVSLKKSGTAILYVDPGTVNLYDLNEGCFREAHRLYEDNSLEKQNPNNSNLAGMLSQAEEIIVVIDVGFTQSTLFATKILPKLKLDPLKLVYYIVTPDSETNQLFFPSILSCYRLYCAVNSTENDNIHFIEREFFYSNGYDNLASVLTLIENNASQTNFHPEGDITRKQIKQYSDDVQKGLWCQRAHVMPMIIAGFEESAISQGCEDLNVLLGQLNVQNYPGQIPDTTWKTPIYVPSIEPILVLALGKRAQEYQSQIKNAVNATVDEIIARKHAPANQVLILIEATTVTKAEMDTLVQLTESCPTLLRVAGVLLPSDNSLYCTLGCVFSKLVETADITMIFPDSDTDANRHIGLLNALVTTDCYWQELFDHMVPWPRMQHVYPFYGDPNDPSNPAQIDDMTTRSVFAINNDVNIQDSAFVGRVPGYMSVLRGNSYECSNFKGGLISSFAFSKQTFTAIGSDKDKFIKSNSAWGTPQELGDDIFLNIEDLIAEYDQYLQPPYEEGQGQGEEMG